MAIIDFPLHSTLMLHTMKKLYLFCTLLNIHYLFREQLIKAPKRIVWLKTGIIREVIIFSLFNISSN